jgi:hypothetical protein
MVVLSVLGPFQYSDNFSLYVYLMFYSLNKYFIPGAICSRRRCGDDQYTAGGDNFATGNWQSYQGDDLDATADLGNE